MCEIDGRVAGYAYASRWRSRSACRFCAESTVYVDPAYAGRGIGTLLYHALLGALGEQGIHAVFGVIALPNDASIALHGKAGFVKAARLREAGWKFGRWIDVEYWQRTF